MKSDILYSAVAVFLVLLALGFGALYFTVQAIPDRLADRTSKVQLQIVGILGLLSLITMNNAYWVAALLLAAIRIPDIVTPLRDIARELASRHDDQSAAAPASEPGPVTDNPEATND